MIFLTENFSVALGQAVAALTPSTYIASLFTPFLLITLSLMCGVTVPPPAIPKFWRVWLYRLNPFTYLVGGMVETEMHGLSIQCRPHEFNIFQPPEGQTCAAYAADYLTSSLGFGYLRNPGSTKDCAYCPWRSGDDFVSQFGLSWEHRWRDLGIIGMFWFTTIFLLVVAGT
jgi:ATP-binding cassette subfamily G (WHITE) protein 2 (SNQ2)